MRQYLLLLAAIAVCMFATVVPAHAQITINGSGSYADIQSAVTAASPGDVIGVPAGTLVHGSNVNINKANLTIQGAGSTSTIIQVSGTGDRFTVAASGVTIQNLQIEKTDKTGVQNIIYVGANDFTLQNTIMRGQFVIGDGDVSRAMVVTGGLSGLLWDNNEFYGLRQPAYVTGTTTGNVTNNYTHRTKGWVLEGGNLTFTGNTWGTGAEVNVYDIAILSSVPPAYYTDIVAMSNANNGAVIEDQRAAPAVLSVVYVDASTAYVSDLGGRYHPYASIQPAITRVVAGGTIHVSAGTYEGQLEIAKALTMEGAGTGSTIVKSPTSLPLYFTSSANNYPVVYIHNTTGVTLRDLTVDGAGRGNSNYRFVGVGFSNAGGTVDGCEVKDIRDTPFSGSQHGVGILSWNNDGTPRTINVLNNSIVGFQKNAMALNAGATTPLAVTVNGNTITGAGPTGVTAQNGVQVYADLGTGEVTGNTVSGIGYTGTSWVATSILNFYADIDIKGNTVTTAHVGVYNIDGAGEISENNLTISKYGDYGYGIIATDPPAAKPLPFDEPSRGVVKGATPGQAGAAATLVVDVLKNEVVFTGGSNIGTVGIEADAGYGPDDIAFTAEQNIVSGFETGFGLFECTSGCYAGVFTGVTLRNNGVDGATYAIYSNLTSPAVDASGNWLGTNTPAGVAAAVTGSVDYTPWLNAGTDTDLGTSGFQGDFSSLWVDDDSPQLGSDGRIEEGIAMVTGSTVNVAAGTYVEGPQVVIGKDVSIVGAGKLTTIITPSANTSNSGDGRGWFLVNAGYEFNLSDVTLDGTGRLISMGILNKGHGTIEGCRFMNIKYNESTAYAGIGMSVRETPLMNVDVTDCEFSGMGRIGVHYRGPGVTGTVSGNTFTGKGPGTWLDYGIEAGGAPLPEGGAKLIISNNTITNCQGVAGDGSTSAGILVTTYFGPGTEATITGCTLMNNTDGIAVGYDGADASVVVAHGNTISGNTAYGINSTNPYVDARYNYWGTLHGPSDAGGTIEVPKNPAPSVASVKNAIPGPNLGNAVTDNNVDYFPWTGPATGHANGGIWAGGYVNPVANDVFMGIDAGALDAVDPYDTVAPPPPPSDYLYLYLLLDPGQPIENYAADVKKDEASLATNAKGWDLRALTDHTSSTVNLVLPPTGLPSGFNPTLYDLTTNDYVNLADDPSYSYTSPGSVTPSAFRVLIGDSTKPAVAVATPNGGEYLVVGTPYNVTWTSSDATGVLRHYIYHSPTGGAPYTLIDSTNGATLTYAWTPGSAAATASIKVTARDSVMNEETDISNSTFTILASSSIAYNAAAGWNLLSVPMLQGVMTPAAVFGDDYGATPYYTFGFNPTSGYSIPATLNMGQGYWLGSNSAQAIDAVGTPLSSASLPLLSGFNIIGNPFATDMDVADLAFTDGFNTYDIAGAATAGWLSNVLYGYNGASYYLESSTLEFWRGYWVPMLVNGITAEYTPTVVTPTPKSVPIVESSDPNAWSVELGAVLKTGTGVEVADRIAAFGVRSDASAAFSPRYDAPRPPRSPAEAFIEVSIGGADDVFRSLFGDAVYARKFLPADRAGWEVVVRTSAPGEVTLRWDNATITALPADVTVELYDAANRRSVDMKNASSYTYAQEGNEQRFNVNRPSGAAVTPVAWELSQNYPNPFNPTTTIAYGLPSAAAVSIEVFNFLGQRVATLLSGGIIQSAGYHEVVFDAAALASGFYYYTITATAGDGAHFSDVRKMILMK